MIKYNIYVATILPCSAKAVTINRQIMWRADKPRFQWTYYPTDQSGLVSAVKIVSLSNASYCVQLWIFPFLFIPGLRDVDKS